jgi:hypothetical protein
MLARGYTAVQVIAAAFSSCTAGDAVGWIVHAGFRGWSDGRATTASLSFVVVHKYLFLQIERWKKVSEF